MLSSFTFMNLRHSYIVELVATISKDIELLYNFIPKTEGGCFNKNK